MIWGIFGHAYTGLQLFTLNLLGYVQYLQLGHYLGLYQRQGCAHGVQGSPL